MEFLDPFLEDHPSDREARLQLARGLWAIGQYESARETLEGKGETTEDPELLLAAARLEWFRGQPAAAEDLVRRVLAASAEHIEAKGELLWILTRTGRGDSAQATTIRDQLYDAYDASRATEPAQLLAVAQAALSRGSSQAFHDANMVLGEAETRAPVAEGSWIGDRIRLQRAEVFLEKYASAEAAETYSLILERDEWNPDALAGLAAVHLEGMRFSDALERAREVLNVDERHPDAHAALAYIALVEGRRQEARRLCEDKVLAVNPLHPEGLAVMAALAVLENDDEAFKNWRDGAFKLDPRASLFHRAVADLMGLLHLYGQTEQVLRAATAQSPNDPYLQSAHGINLLRLGKEQEGLSALQAAWNGDPFNVRTQNILDLYEQRIKPHYVDVQVDNVTLRLPSEDQKFVQPEIMAAVRTARKALSTRYRMDPGPLRLEFFANAEEFSVRTMGVPSLGAVGVCFGNVVTFVGPYDGQHNLHGVVWHEMAHIFAIAKSKGRVPRWFTEGLSEWESELADPSWARESARLLLAARKRGKLRPLSELEQAFIRAESALMMEAAYATSAYALRYLGETFGIDPLIGMLAGYGEGLETDALVMRHLGRDLPTLEREFDAWLVSELTSRVKGWHPSIDGNGGPRDTRDRLFSRAEASFRARDFDQTVSSVKTLVERNGDGFETQMLWARALMREGKVSAARQHLEKALEFDLEAIAPLVLLANIAHQKGDVPGEKQYLEHALALDGDAFDPAARLLMLAEVTQDSKLRPMALARAGAIAPLHPIVMATHALDHARAGRSAAAKPLFQRATGQLGRKKGPADTYVMAALAARALGNDPEAQELAQVALADPHLPAPARSLLEPPKDAQPVDKSIR